MDPHLFAGVRVREYRAARPWYERLFGEPSFLPHDTEAVWTVAANRSVFIVEHPEAGHAVLLLFLDDLDGWVAEVADRGLEPTERETYDNGVRKAIYRDPDGNRVEFGGAPVEDAA